MNRFAQFAEVASSRVSLRLRGGVTYEGYIFDVIDDAFVLGVGGPLAPDEPVVLRWADIDPDSLAYYDSSREAWVELAR
ncbi:MAG: hypothetical protein AAGA54_09120 [Myxococcota bacterium]